MPETVRMFSFFKKSTPAPVVVTAQSTLAKTSSPRTGVEKPTTPVYPPVDKGINVDPLEEILASQAEFIKRLRVLAGGDENHFNQYFEQVIRNLAEYVHLLPASRDDAHPGAGGLFRLCLEMGFFALQASERYVFSANETVELRRVLEPRWKYATFLAALCRELYRPLSDVIVTDQSGNQWPKHLTSLMGWAKNVNASTYFLNWQPSSKTVHTMVAGRSDVAAVMIKILPQYTLQYLEDGSPNILPVVFAVASGSAHPSDNQVARLVHETREKVIQRDRALRPQQYGKLQVGNHLSPYLLDAMRQLYRNGTWTINGDKSRMWLAPEGLYLIWKSAGKEILATLADIGVSGVPKDLSTLSEMMADAKIIELNDGHPLFMITPPGAKDAYQAVKIAQPISILEDDQIEPVNISVNGSIATAADVKPLKQQSSFELDDKSDADKGKVAPVKARPKKNDAPATEPIDTNRDLLSQVDNSTQDIAEGGGLDEDGPPQLDSAPEEWELNANGSDQAKASRQEGQEAQHQKVARPSKLEVDQDAVIAPVMQSESYAEKLPEIVRTQMEKRPDLLEVLGKMLDDYQKGRHKTFIFDVPQGVAFETQQVLKYGLPFDRIVGTLFENRWLETPVGNANAKTLKVKNPAGKTVPAIVINLTGITHLGFRGDNA